MREKFKYGIARESQGLKRRDLLLSATASALLGAGFATYAHAQQTRLGAAFRATRRRALRLLSGKGPSNRREIFYFEDEGGLNALRYGDWKLHFAIKNEWWGDLLQPRTVPLVINLREDPFEVTGIENVYPLVCGQAVDAHAGAGYRWTIPRIVQGIPAAAEINDLQH